MSKFSQFHLSNNARLITKSIPGPNSKKLLKKQSEVEGSIVSYPKSIPIAIRLAKGAIIEDVDGNQLIDFFAGCGVVNVGHVNEEVLNYVFKQQKDLIHALDFPTENKLDLIESILSLVSESKDSTKWRVSFCGPSGSDAVEAAIKLAKHNTKRSSVIAFQGSYHGLTSASLAATSDLRFREGINTTLPEVHFVPYSYCYRCAFQKDPGSCQFECARYLENLLENPQSGISKPAAIILEPMQGEGGNIIPKEGYLDEIVRIARKHGVLVIYDEIQSGFFRTGKFLSYQFSEEEPDIITISKGLGGIGFPISAIIYRKEIESWNSGMHVGTFRANQVSIAAARGALAFIKKYDIPSHVEKVSKLLLEKLRDLKEKYDVIGEVRGKGLYIGVEFVKNKLDKKPNPEIVKLIKENSISKGLLFEVGGHFQNVIRFVPPLIINDEIIDNAMEKFDSAIRDALMS